MKKRDYSVDFIRIIAIILVVLTHAVETVGINGGIPKIEYVILFCLGRVGVPLFFIISGFLLLTKKYNAEDTKRFYLKNLIPLIVCWELWVIIYNLFLISIGNEFIGVGELVKEMLFLRYVGITSEWYMPCIIIIYALIPFIANALNSVKIKYTIILSIAFYLFSNFLYTFFDIIATWNNYVNVIYFQYIILGFLAFHLKNKMPNLLKLLIIIVSFISFVLWEHYTQSEIYIWYDSAFLPVVGFFLFSLLNSTISIKKSRMLPILANCSFGVYLLHIIFILVSNKYFYIDNIQLRIFVNFIPTIIICFIVTFLFSLTPYVGSILFRTKYRLTDKISHQQISN